MAPPDVPNATDNSLTVDNQSVWKVLSMYQTYWDYGYKDEGILKILILSEKEKISDALIFSGKKEILDKLWTSRTSGELPEDFIVSKFKEQYQSKIEAIKKNPSVKIEIQPSTKRQLSVLQDACDEVLKSRSDQPLTYEIELPHPYAVTIVEATDSKKFSCEEAKQAIIKTKAIIKAYKINSDTTKIKAGVDLSRIKLTNGKELKDEIGPIYAYFCAPLNSSCPLIDLMQGEVEQKLEAIKTLMYSLTGTKPKIDEENASQIELLTKILDAQAKQVLENFIDECPKTSVGDVKNKKEKFKTLLELHGWPTPKIIKTKLNKCWDDSKRLANLQHEPGMSDQKMASILQKKRELLNFSGEIIQNKMASILISSTQVEMASILINSTQAELANLQYEPGMLIDIIRYSTKDAVDELVKDSYENTDQRIRHDAKDKIIRLLKGRDLPNSTETRKLLGTSWENYRKEHPEKKAHTRRRRIIDGAVRQNCFETAQKIQMPGRDPLKEKKSDPKSSPESSPKSSP